MGALIYYILGFIWALFTGFVFSTTGAAGGILASFGFIAVLHIHAANSVKLMSEILVIMSPIIALPIYFRQERTKQIKSIFFYISFTIATGSIFGALFGSWFSKNYLSDLKSFKYFLGYLTFLVMALMIYNILNQKKKKTEQGKKEAVRDTLKIGEEGNLNIPSKVKFSVKKIDFRYINKDYSVPPVVFFIIGFVVAIIAAVFGAGGGFLIVPILTDVIGLPVFLSAGISILVVFITAIVSVSSYIIMGVPVIVPILSVTLVGVIVGSIVGSKISVHLNENMLKYLLIVLLFFVGVFYVYKP